MSGGWIASTSAARNSRGGSLVDREALEDVGLARRRRLHREAEEPQSGRPALRALDDRRELVVGELDPHPAEQRARLGLVERELASAQLGEIAGDAQHVQGERRVDPRCRHEVQLRRRHAQYAVERCDRGGRREVQVVDHEHERLLELGGGLHEALDERRRRVVARRSEPVEEHLAPERRADRVEQLLPERRPVRLPQRDPRERRLTRAVAQPRREEDGLAGAGRPGDECQRALRGAGVEQLEEPVALDDGGRRLRQMTVQHDLVRLIPLG